MINNLLQSPLSSFSLTDSRSHLPSQTLEAPSNTKFTSISTTRLIIRFTTNTVTHLRLRSSFAYSNSNPYQALPTDHHFGMVAASSSSDGQLSLCADDFKPFQLDDVPDFNRVASPEGYISICGFGSLLSERSARSTFPNLMNFRVARLKGFRRAFINVATVFFERGIAKPETKEMSSLSVEPCEDEELIVTVFEIQKSEVPSFVERELEFRFLAVLPETLEGKAFTHPAVLCTRSSNEEFFNIRCKGSKEIYHQHYGRYNIDKVWRDDILPCRTYLRHCVLAAKNLGDAAYNNFLDHTYLGDRKTTIREYLAMRGSGIMEEEPPESLRTRYGG